MNPLSRINETIRNFAAELEEIVDAPVMAVSLPLSVSQRDEQQEGIAVYVQLPGECGCALRIGFPLSVRERRMVERIAREYRHQAEKNAVLASQWITRSVLNRQKGGREAGVPETVDEIFGDGQVYYPFLLNGSLPEGSEDLLESYFGTTVVMQRYEDVQAQLYTALLVVMQDEAMEGEHLEELVEEWTQGLALLLEEELGKEMAVGGFYPAASPSDWIGALADMQNEFEAYPEFYQNHAGPRPVYVPWRFPANKLITLIPADQQEKFKQTYIQDAKDTVRFLFEREGLKTLRAFFDQNLNVSETARVLHVHRNTLLYRLDKIRSLTGLDPKSFEDALLIHVLLLLLEQTVQSAW